MNLGKTGKPELPPALTNSRGGLGTRAQHFHGHTDAFYIILKVIYFHFIDIVREMSSSRVYRGDWVRFQE